jgi:hypothetical protein
MHASISATIRIVAPSGVLPSPPINGADGFFKPATAPAGFAFRRFSHPSRPPTP